MAEYPIELEPLLAPLDGGEGGVGEDLRTDYSPSSPYQRLRDARASARAEERARDAEGDAESPPAEGWKDVLQVGQQALASRSKDFEIAAWLTEALVRYHGLSGLECGARLITGLCEQFWDNGFPQPDEEGLEGRGSPIGGLAGAGADGTVMQPLRRLPLFRRADGTPLGIYQWDQAEETAGLNEDRREARYAAGVPELATLVAEARIDRGFLVGSGRAATAALAAWKEMDRVLDERFGSEAPSTRNVTVLLERILEVIGRLGGLETPEAESAGAEAEGAAVAAPDGAIVVAGGGGGGGGGGAGVLRTREDALRELDRIADFFRRTEPHSPLAYTLEEAVRRGRMSLAELLAEVLPDEDSRNAMLSRLGIRPNMGNE
jgi:type VI secretion system protein ImpA